MLTRKVEQSYQASSDHTNVYLTRIIEGFEYSKRVERSKDDTIHDSKALILNRRGAKMLLGEVLATLFPWRVIGQSSRVLSSQKFKGHTFETADDALAFDNAFALI